MKPARELLKGGRVSEAEYEPPMLTSQRRRYGLAVAAGGDAVPACESRARSTWRSEIEPQFDTHFAGDMIGSVPEEKATRGASRYEAVIATLVGFCALCVSGYTAYIQRQQVRGAVWPILQFDSGNGPIRFILANKGVGPAIIKHVVLKVDDQPVKNWVEVLDKILGPGYHPGESADMGNRVYAAGELVNVFTPHNDAREPIPFDKSNPLWAKLDKDRSRVTVEICYCSTLDECWTLRAGGTTPSTTTPTRQCPTPSAITFQQ